MDKLEETVHDNEAETTLFCKTAELNNPKTNVLTHNRFDTCLVLFFSDLNKAQIDKMPYRDDPHHEIELLMSFVYLKLFKPIEQTEDYHIRKPNDEIFLSEIKDKKMFM